MSCEYEKIRLRNIEDNKRILKELGLLNPFNPLPRVIKTAPKRKRARSPESDAARPAKRVAKEVAEAVEDASPVKSGRRRRSARIRGIDVNKAEEEPSDVEAEEDDDDEAPKRKFPKDRPNTYGAIPGVEVGTVWQLRSDCSYDGIHRPWVAGIHGGPDGAISIALSGGYEDDIDMGDCFTYTGEGGRDLKGTKANPKNLRTAPQSKDQSLTKGNLALVRSVETGQPIRVIRGFKSRGPFAPEDGYRYDGLYKVEKYWFTTGTSGFGIYKFAFRRLENQAPPPWTFEGVDNNNNNEKTDKNSDDDDDNKKAAAEFESMTVEEKLQKMMERDGLTYNPSESKIETETKQDTEASDVDVEGESESDSETETGLNDAEKSVDELEKSETKENVTKSETDETLSNKKGKSVDELEESETKENVTKIETGETVSNNKDERVDELEKSETKENVTESETDVTVPQKKEESVEAQKKSETKDNRSEIEAETTFSQDSGFASQESEGPPLSITEIKSRQTVSKTEPPLKEINNSNMLRSDVNLNDQEKSKAMPETSKSENNVETNLESSKNESKGPETPQVTKTPKTLSSASNTPKSDDHELPKTPKNEKKPKETQGEKKSKGTTPKVKQLTMMHLFKPKPKN